MERSTTSRAQRLSYPDQHRYGTNECLDVSVFRHRGQPAAGHTVHNVQSTPAYDYLQQHIITHLVWVSRAWRQPSCLLGI
jgi:hypothetical protein